jgi:hypothetical protein
MKYLSIKITLSTMLYDIEKTFNLEKQFHDWKINPE